jgi:hypothetical protein
VCATLDDLVIALYVTVDELVEPRRGPGCRPRLSDAELVCLAVAQVLLGYHSERRWLRAVADRLGHLFPYVCGRPPTTAGCAARPRWSPRSWVPWRWPARRGATSGGCWTPPRSRVATAERRSSGPSWPAGPATAGTPAITASGGVSSCMCWPPPTACRSRVPGQPQRRRAGGRRGAVGPRRPSGGAAPRHGRLGRQGVGGTPVRRGRRRVGATLARPDRADEPARFGNLGGVRQWIEAIFDTLKDQLGLERHGATPSRASGSGSPSGCWLWPLGSGSTGSLAPGQALPGRL